MTGDVLVAGGGPAGLATAIALAARGIDVRVLDARRPPIDKACGEGLMPGGVAALARLGVAIPPGAGMPFRGIRFVDRGRRVEAQFPVGRGLGVRRPDLHRALVSRAEAAGIAISWGVRVGRIEQHGAGVRVETSEGPRTARWLVGADGLTSSVRRAAGLDAGPGPRRRYGTRRHFRMAPWTDHVEVHWSAERVEAYVTPVAADMVGVALLHGDPSRHFDDLLGSVPELAERLAGHPAATTDRGAGPLHRLVHAVARGPIALVGDAAGYLDAISGEGLSLAFLEAAALADAIAAADLSLYVEAHRELSAAPLSVTRMMLLAERRPWLRKAALDLLARKPRLLSDLLGIMNGAEGFRPSLASRLAVAAL